MPIELEGALSPLNTVFGIDAAVLPAAFGFITALALAIGIHKMIAIEIIFISNSLALISIGENSCRVGESQFETDKSPQIYGTPC